MSPETVMDRYRPEGAAFDEMYAAPGMPRPHWEQLSRSLNDLGIDELIVRRQEAARLLRQSGVTYNVYAHDETRAGKRTGRSGEWERAWKLDPIPLVVDSGEWANIERGLLQRAAVLNLILADLYGARQLLRQGLLPPATVFSHPGFVRSCAGMQYGRPGLITVGADLARHSNGQFLVMADRAQAPSGAGYALENRMVLARALPDLYQDARVHRLAGYFRALRQTLAALSPRQSEDPRIVVLTPGPGNETYFEHAFLASYLGYTLVEGSDLVVQQGQVWIRTVERLEPVDVILRRMDDAYLDPLELKPDSLLGTPGLLHAMRAGNVAIANPPGSGILDNPALLPYLPAVCRHLLGQELSLPSVPTFWCGDPVHREHVLANIDRLIVKSIFPKHGGRSYFAAQLGQAGRESLLEAIRRRPYHYVGQEQVNLSTVPYLRDPGGSRQEYGPSAFETRPMILRTFLLAKRTTETDDSARQTEFLLMPGGLTRVSNDPHSPIVSNQRGGVAKDTWVMAGEAGRETTFLRGPVAATPLTRRGGDVASRVADNLYWLGRYIERADAMVRVLREILRYLLENQPTVRGASATPDTLLEALSHLTANYPGFLAPEAREAPEAELLDLIYNHERPGGLAFNLGQALSAGRRVRDRLSEDNWRILNTMQERFLHRKEPGRTLRALENLAILLAAFAGVCNETMNHGQGWRFLEIGRRVERAISTFSILRTVFASHAVRDEVLLETVLYLKDSLRVYHRRYQARAIEPEAALDILLLDEGHPQSAGYQIARLNELAADLPESSRGARRGSGRSREERLIIEAQSLLRLTEMDSLRETSELDQLLQRLNFTLCAFSDALTSHYLTPGELPRQVQV